MTFRSDCNSGLPPHVGGAAITVGTFDGVHRGHLDVIERLISHARARNLASVVITFDPHPLYIVNPSAAPLLLTIGSEKTEVLSESELDYLIVLPFTHDLAALSAEDFVDRVLIGKYRMQHLLVGHDHGFGRQRAGNPQVLQELGKERGFSVEVVPAVSADDGKFVSSTVIRRAIAGGDLETARQMLGRPYSVSGKVVPGEQRGRVLGFPTLNLSDQSPRKLLPPDGVYAARVQTPLGEYKSMVHIGPRPTFGDQNRTIEAYLMDADKELDLYGARIRIDLVRRLRDVMKFDSPEALIAHIQADEREARSAL